MNGWVRGAPVRAAFTVTLTLLAVTAARAGAGPRRASLQEAPVRTDYLTFAQGAVPLSIGGPGADVDRPPDAEDQVYWIDGDPTPRGFITTQDTDIVTEFTYELPAPTTFDRLAVPRVLEVPSPRQTFTRRVEVLGSASGPDDGYVTLASADLEIHASRDEVTELPIVATPAVRWVRLRLEGGIDIQAETMNFDFSEIIGNGTQETPPMSDRFAGAWDSRFVKMELAQDGPLVSGCYDSEALLTGTVTGNILKATGVDQGGARTPSTFVLAVLADGTLTGVRSTNGGPFRLYTGGPVEDVARLDCLVPPPPLGCGSVIHGINFDFDAADIRPESEPVLAKLYEGLAADPAASIVIRGHTSSEGTDEYNLSLSERRAQSVVDDLVARGLDGGRMRATGVGEAEPIATNDDEAGRALNRRVEVSCGA